MAPVTITAYAFSQAGEIVRVPEVIRLGNSQTMNLLEGYLNINPTGTGGAEIAIAGGVALESNGGGESEVFVDLGKSGTGQISVHVVRQGDTLSEIAEMFGVSVNTIIWANDIRGTSIKEGQELVILPISGVRHVVKKGDNLQSIAKKYKAGLDDILSFNGLTASTKIIPGDIVIIPDGVVSTQTSIARSSTVRRSQSFPTYSGFYLRPLAGGRKSQGAHGNNAVDIAASTGTPVLASADGKVIISRSGGYNGGYGTYVVISHSNGTQTLYAHMSKKNVLRGQSVLQGQVIGAVGSTGRSTGPHLHFEVRGAKNPF